jgi:hypothetical protein
LLRFAHKPSENRLSGDFLPRKLLSDFSRQGAPLIGIFVVQSAAKIHKCNRLLVSRQQRDSGLHREFKEIYHHGQRPGESNQRFAGARRREKAKKLGPLCAFVVKYFSLIFSFFIHLLNQQARPEVEPAVRRGMLFSRGG